MVKLGLMAGGLTGEQIDHAISMARESEELGFDSLWLGEGRLMGSVIPHMTVALRETSRIKIGTGIIPYRTRNVGLLAATFKTLDEIAPGRVRMGLGAWWEPLATRVGLPNRKPLTAMREIVTVAKRLLNGETVSFDGEFIQVSDIRFDSPLDDDGRFYDVPIYIGAVRFGMLALAGELCDGVLLDFLVPTSYTEDALDAVRKGAARSGRSVDTFDVPQLVACTVDDQDPAAAVDICRAFLTQYLAQQPHITEFAGADPELIEAVKKKIPWPSTTADVWEASKLVPDSLVRSVAACGTTTQVVDKIEEYAAAGITEAVLCPRGDNESETIRKVARRFANRAK